MRIILFLLLFLPFFITAQTWSPPGHRMSLKLSPVSFIQPYVGPCGKLSLEYKVKNNIAFQHEVGIFFAYSKGVETKFEVKRYLEFEDQIYGNYISLEGFYKYQSYTTDRVVDTGDVYEQNYIILEPFDVTKNVEALSFKCGNLNIIEFGAKRFGLVVDSYLGLGLRFQQVRNSLSEKDNANMPETSDYGPNLILDKARNKVYPNIVLGVKVGFRVQK